MDMTYLPVEENASLILGGDTSYAIPYCADEPERAMMVLNAIYSQPDLYNTLIYGIEGEDYTKNADGTITTSYVGASPTADDSYGIQRWIIGSCKNALINNGTDPNVLCGSGSAGGDCPRQPVPELHVRQNECRGYLREHPERVLRVWPAA